MANSWSELGWNIGAWGLQNDTTASLSSFELTFTLGDETAAGELL